MNTLLDLVSGFDYFYGEGREVSLDRMKRIDRMKAKCGESGLFICIHPVHPLYPV